mmetsp:Transcript_8806/g.26710  ORF Transcript_8806/g.26710 Transcript_8806/m.26710 type:complete len:222 (+) Transcript_8806:705-1370(+)
MLCPLGTHVMQVFAQPGVARYAWLVRVLAQLPFVFLRMERRPVYPLDRIPLCASDDGAASVLRHRVLTAVVRQRVMEEKRIAGLGLIRHVSLCACGEAALQWFTHLGVQPRARLRERRLPALIRLNEVDKHRHDTPQAVAVRAILVGGTVPQHLRYGATAHANAIPVADGSSAEARSGARYRAVHRPRQDEISERSTQERWLLGRKASTQLGTLLGSGIQL